MTAPIIECREVTLAYQDEIVVDKVNLSIAHGALLPFVGPNGAGKTTLFNAMLGLLKPRSGVIVRRFGARPPGYVPQQKQIDPLYPVSVRQIVAMGLYPEAGPWPGLKKSLRQRLDDTLAWFGLAEHERKTFAELSGGMRQKALIARAVVSPAEVIFLDEPLAGLDAAAEEATLQMLIDLNRSHGRTIILAHHRLEDLSRLASQVCLVNHQQATLVPADQAAATLAAAWRPNTPRQENDELLHN